MNLTDYVRRVDQILVLGNVALQTQYSGYSTDFVKDNEFAMFRSAALSLLANLFGADHPYYGEFNRCVFRTEPGDVEAGIGILLAVKQDLDGGWLRTARGLLSAEIFGDFLEMSEHLVSEHYKDAAAVIAGSSLEEHLRQLAIAAGISITNTKGTDIVPKRADALNAELASAGVYSKLDQKSVTAWLDLRNKAAHGQYAAYDEAQVSLMIEGIRQFLARVPV